MGVRGQGERVEGKKGGKGKRRDEIEEKGMGMRGRVKEEREIKDRREWLSGKE